MAPPGKVTRVRIRVAPQTTLESQLHSGFNPFPFDATKGPGYVWHCHILDHEDSDMMRPMKATAPWCRVTARLLLEPLCRLSPGIAGLVSCGNAPKGGRRAYRLCVSPER